MDGLFGLAISPRKSSDDNSNAVAGSLNRRSSSSASERSLYFHALASGHENSVPLRILNDASIWQNDANAQPRAFKQIGRRDIQTPGPLTTFPFIPSVSAMKTLFLQPKRWTETAICISYSSARWHWFVGTLQRPTPSRTSK